MRIAITSIGTETFAMNVAYNLVRMGFHIVNTINDDFEILFNIGMYFNSDSIINITRKRKPKVKIVQMWCGSDILQFYQNFYKDRPVCYECIMSKIDLHVTTYEQFAKELRDIYKVDPLVVPIVPEKELKLEPLPDKFKVMFYSHKGSQGLYQKEVVDKLSKDLPNIDFYVVGFGWTKKDIKKEMGNLHYVPFIIDTNDKYEFFKDMSLLIYIPVNLHKYGMGVGVTSIEFLQMGRNVIRNGQYPYVIPIRTYDDIVNQIKKIRNNNKPNIEGSKYYLSKYNFDEFKKAINRVIDKL